MTEAVFNKNWTHKSSDDTKGFEGGMWSFRYGPFEAHVYIKYYDTKQFSLTVLTVDGQRHILQRNLNSTTYQERLLEAECLIVQQILRWGNEVLFRPVDI